MIARDECVEAEPTADRPITRRCAACRFEVRSVERPKQCPNCGLTDDVVIRPKAPPPPKDGGEWVPCCARCGSDVYRQECESCGGEGLNGHDCGEDCCCCADPEEPNVTCDICGDDGGWWNCLSDRKWCEANPRPGRATVPRGAIEWFVIRGEVR